MRLRTLPVVLAAAMGAALASACGSASDRPPPAELSSIPPDATTGSRPIRDAATAPRDAAPRCLESDGAPSACSCPYTYNNIFGIEIPCGFTVCSQGNSEAAECNVRGELTIVPNADVSRCPPADSDASGLPPCDAGILGDGSR